ncbi:MAG TPA: di-heme oxidoredictase family protein [Puia sp.]|nr:di-heme oxidoredictase family protein [Puia sp.]
MKRKATLLISAIVLVIAGLSSCYKLLPQMPDSTNTLCGPVSLSNAQAILFAAGNDQFFAIRTAATGLGPYFVSTGCGECHSSDNRGHPFTILTRFGQSDTSGNTFMADGGPQFQNANLPGLMPQQIPPGATSSKLIAPITAGVGFLECVPDSEILAMAAANLTNPDGVRGHPNYDTIPSWSPINVNSIPRGDGKYICRFGRKASVYSLFQQVANAYNRDMGITSTYLPFDPYNYLDQVPAAPSTPEVNDDDFNSVVFYVTCLQTPNQRDTGNATVKYGSQVFNTIGCASCHKPVLTTGYSPVASLAYQTINPYTDLLVHDMGPGLDDGYTEGNAKTSEWRTAPLWGLGLAPGVQGGNYYLLHDGRAHSIEDAITMHGGEAAVAAGRFNSLSASDRSALLTFLKSL